MQLTPNSPRMKIFREIIRSSGVDILFLLIAFYASVLLAPLFKLPFQNPYEISNPLNPTGFNPENNFYQIVFIIAGTVVGYVALKFLYARRRFMLIKSIIILILALSFFLGQSLQTPGYSTGQNGLDNFHAGEILSPSHAFSDGKNLYSEIFYLRGAGIDAVIPSLAYVVAGESVGTFLMLMDALMIMALICFLILLTLIIKNPIWFSLAAVAAYCSQSVSLVEIRDVFIWITAGLLLATFQTVHRHRTRLALLVLIGIISSFTIYVVIDRGVILFVAALLLATTLVFVSMDSNGAIRFSPKTWLSNAQNSLAVLAGIAVGLLVPVPFIGLDGFQSFITMTFIEIPKFGGLLVSQPFPSLFSDRYLIWGPVLLAIATIIGMLMLYRLGWRTRLNVLVPLTVLLIIGLLCIKGGSNRIDLTKMASVITPLILASSLIMWQMVSEARNGHRSVSLLALPIVATSVILVAFAQFDFSRLVIQPTYSRSDVKQYLRLPRTSDEKWISLESRGVRDAILNTTKPGDYIFAFTSNPIYYYLADRQNPTRFYVSWFADPQPYTTELLADLRKRPPSLIIYEEKTWMDAPDTISMETRIPEVSRWIKQNYSRSVVVGNTTLLYKN